MRCAHQNFVNKLVCTCLVWRVWQSDRCLLYASQRRVQTCFNESDDVPLNSGRCLQQLNSQHELNLNTKVFKSIKNHLLFIPTSLFLRPSLLFSPFLSDDVVIPRPLKVTLSRNRGPDLTRD